MYRCIFIHDICILIESELTRARKRKGKREMEWNRGQRRGEGGRGVKTEIHHDLCVFMCVHDDVSFLRDVHEEKTI